MYAIQHSNIVMPTPFNKTIAGLGLAVTISFVALSLIGLTGAPSGPFNAIVQFGKSANGILLGTSLFVFILDLVWMAALCKKKKEPDEDEDGHLVIRMDPTAILPNEISSHLFSYLDVSALESCSKVSKKWHALAAAAFKDYDLRRISPLITVFDETNWAACGLDVSDVPPLDKLKAIRILKKCLSSWQMEVPIYGKAGIMVVTIIKGLTINKLISLISKLKGGEEFAKVFFVVSGICLHNIGDIEVNETYRVAITTNIFKGSRKQSISAQKTIAKKFDCEMPKVLEVLTLLIAMFIDSGEAELYRRNPHSLRRLYQLTPMICSECVDKYGHVTNEDGFPMMIGGSCFDGIEFYSHQSDHLCQSRGIGGVRRNI